VIPFKIGDRVRVVSGATGYRGRAGTITGVLSAPDAPANQQEAIELLRGYAVELDDGQLELFFGVDLEPEESKG
jgi:hypothetical protein